MKTFLVVLWFSLLTTPFLRTANGEDTKHDMDSDAKEVSNPSGPEDKALDGIPIKAVEDYPKARSDAFGLGLSYVPFRPYYSAMAFYIDYSHALSPTITWEIINASYAVTWDSNLTQNLINPPPTSNITPVASNRIERLQAIVSTNLVTSFTQGKLLFFDKYIRYFRASGIFGGGAILTSLQTLPGFNVGMRLDTFVTDSFSWKLELRDMVSFSGFEGYFSVCVGANFNF
jgi:hypothetical protein